MPKNDIYAVGVRFNDMGGWSKVYTYKSYVSSKPGSIVLVDASGLPKVAHVVSCHDEFTFDPRINYKNILADVTPLVPDEIKDRLKLPKVLK